MDESRTAFRAFREGRNRMYRWFQRWMGRGASEESEERGDPVDVSHIVNLLRAGLGFRLRYVDQGQTMADCEPGGPGCRVVTTCTTSGLRAVLELPQAVCCCRTKHHPDAETNFWSVTSSTESLHEAGCSSLPELNQGLAKVVKEVLGQLHHVMIELNNPLALKEITAKNLTTGSLQSLTPSPCMEKMRRISSSPMLQKDNSPAWSHQIPNEHPNDDGSATSLQEFTSIASTEISPIKGSTTISIPSYRTSSPHSVQSSLEKLSVESNSTIIKELKEIHKELGNVLSLAKGNSSAVKETTRKLPTVNTPAATRLRKPLAVSRAVQSPGLKREQMKILDTPKTLARSKTILKPQSSVKRFFSGSKVNRNGEIDTASSTCKSTPILAKRRTNSQASGQKSDAKLKPGHKKLS